MHSIWYRLSWTWFMIVCDTIVLWSHCWLWMLAVLPSNKFYVNKYVGDVNLPWQWRKWRIGVIRKIWKIINFRVWGRERRWIGTRSIIGWKIGKRKHKMFYYQPKLWAGNLAWGRNSNWPGEVFWLPFVLPLLIGPLLIGLNGGKGFRLRMLLTSLSWSWLIIKQSDFIGIIVGILSEWNESLNLWYSAPKGPSGPVMFSLV